MLRKILRDYKTSVILKDYLSDTGCSNDVPMIHDLQDYKSFPASEYKTKEARKIYRTYIM